MRQEVRFGLHILVNASGQKYPAVANWGSSYCKSWEWHLCSLDTWNLGCLRRYPWKNNFGTSTTEKPRVKRRTSWMLLDPWALMSFCLMSLTLLSFPPLLAPPLPPSPHLPIPFSLSASHLLLNGGRTIDFSVSFLCTITPAEASLNN